MRVDQTLLLCVHDRCAILERDYCARPLIPIFHLLWYYPSGLQEPRNAIRGVPTRPESWNVRRCASLTTVYAKCAVLMLVSSVLLPFT